MKKIILISVAIFIFLSSLVCYKFLKIRENEKQKLSLTRDGLFYEAGTNRLFSGIIKDTIDVIIEFQVVEGIKHGNFKTYFLNGQVEKEGYIENDKNVGEWKYYFDNGQLATIGNFKENFPHDQWVSYYNNGNTKIIGAYKNGKQDGAWKYYDINGKLISITYYIDGKISSIDSLV
jgi:antitoxin component YwqK of YwqJK toxin-antitoxin module